jgi:hypothetical protein
MWSAHRADVNLEPAPVQPGGGRACLEAGSRSSCDVVLLEAERLPRRGPLLLIGVGSGDTGVVESAARALLEARTDVRFHRVDHEGARGSALRWLAAGHAVSCSAGSPEGLARLVRMALTMRADVAVFHLPQSPVGASPGSGRRAFVVRTSLPITWHTLAALPSETARLAYLGWKAHALAQCGVGEAPGGDNRAPLPALVPSVPVRVLEAEIRSLGGSERLLVTDEHVVGAARAVRIPHLLRAIGRLREVTWRRTGQGTGKSIDRDRFDDDCYHLFAWHRPTQTLQGAVRLGLSDELLEQGGSRGLYSTTLFDLGRGARDGLLPGVEFSRLVVDEAESAWPLVFRGIAAFLARRPRYERVFGALQLPGGYARFSLDLMARALGRGPHLHPLAGDSRPKHPVPPFSGRSEPPGVEVVLDDMARLASVVSDAEPDGKGLPAIVRDVLELGGKFFGFAAASSFSRVLTGLVVINLRHLRPRPLELGFSSPILPHTMVGAA